MSEYQVTRLQEIIERDRSKVASAVTVAMRALKSYEWLRLGRGSYEHNDDRWRDEFARAFDAFTSALAPLRAIAADRSDCPETMEAVDRARHDTYYPTIYENEESGMMEFVLKDGPTLHQKGDHYDVILDMETREVIGFAWPIGTNPAQHRHNPKQPNKTDIDPDTKALADRLIYFASNLRNAATVEFHSGVPGLGAEFSTKNDFADALDKAAALLIAGELKQEEWQPTHQHYKGGLYRLLMDNIDWEPDMDSQGRPRQITVYDNKGGHRYARFSTVFEGRIEDPKNNYHGPRFRKILPEELK